MKFFEEKWRPKFNLRRAGTSLNNNNPYQLSMISDWPLQPLAPILFAVVFVRFLLFIVSSVHLRFHLFIDSDYVRFTLELIFNVISGGLKLLFKNFSSLIIMRTQITCSTAIMFRLFQIFNKFGDWDTQLIKLYMGNYLYMWAVTVFFGNKTFPLIPRQKVSNRIQVSFLTINKKIYI